MKTLHLVILLALLSSVLHAQSRTMADATYALKGPVRTFRTEVATFTLRGSDYIEGPRVVQSEASFNVDGNRTDLRIYDNKGVLVRRIVMTFEGRRMTESINYDGAGKMWLRMVHIYDEAGQIKETKSYRGDGSLSSTRSFKRNTNGQISEMAEYSAEGVPMEQINNRYEGPNLYSSERRLFDPTGTLRSKELYVASEKRRDTTNYNADGSVTTKTIHTEQQIAEYSADGSLRKSTTVSSQGRLLDEVFVNNDGPSARRAQIPDEVDSHGNWTKQTQWETDAKGTRPLKVTYRAITYYTN